MAEVIEFNKAKPKSIPMSTPEQHLIDNVKIMQDMIKLVSDCLTVLETMRQRHGIESYQFEKAYNHLVDSCRGQSNGSA